MTRYAVLHHTGVPSPHFDVMVEPSPGADLLTWRCPAWPVESPTVVERLTDHRRRYMDYEGEVGGNRGRVDRVAGGVCTVAVGPDGVWTVDLPACRLTIRPTADQGWVLSVG